MNGDHASQACHVYGTLQRTQLSLLRFGDGLRRKGAKVHVIAACSRHCIEHKMNECMECVHGAIHHNKTLITKGYSPSIIHIQIVDKDSSGIPPPARPSPVDTSMGQQLGMKSWSWIAIAVAVVATFVGIIHLNGPHHNGTGVSFGIWDSSQLLRALITRSTKTPFAPSPPKADSCACAEVPDPEEHAACQLQGVVPDCCCSYAAVERVNRDSMRPLLAELVRTPFFRYFKTDLYCECPLWPEDGMCSLRDCSVCECEPEEIPEPWRKEEELHDKESCDSLQRESNIDRTILPSMKAKLMSVHDWKGYRNPWMPDENGVEYSYINLLRNGERYTGYKGEHANRVWKAIYEQPCFKDVLNAVTDSEANIHPERRVFYKLISGMHSSITAHIVGDYLIDEATDTWGPNLEMFKWRLGNPQVKDRVENLYFTYLFVLRAVMKASPILERVGYDTASPKEDAQTQALLRKLLNSSALKHTCPVPFDEGRLWKGEDAESLRGELQGAFRNITRIMDCVGCEKCKMWGKLQLLGIATSLKVLFSTEDCTGNGNDIGAARGEGNRLPPLVLERNEVIALVNLLERLSASVEIVRSLSLQLADRHVHPQGLGAIQDLTKERLSTGLTS